jgi:hypothetical protein
MYGGIDGRTGREIGRGTEGGAILTEEVWNEKVLSEFYDGVRIR